MSPGAASAAASGPSSAGLGVRREQSFRIPIPPTSQAGSSSSSSAHNHSNSTATVTAAMSSLPSTVPQSPGGSSSSRFGFAGFRRNRGQSTNKDIRNASQDQPPSPGVPFPALASSVSQPDLSPSPSAGRSGMASYFDGEHGASSNNVSSSSTSGARGYFSRRGFTRKMTGNGSRTPTGEGPPLLNRSRSSSQPSLPLAQQGTANQQLPASANNPSFPPLDASTVSASYNPLSQSVMSTNTVHAQTESSSSANAPSTVPSTSGAAPAAANVTGQAASSSSTGQTQHIRLVPHLETTRSLTFDPVAREVQPTVPLRIGRFTDRNPGQPASSLDQYRIAFKSKVVSRTHAEIWYDPGTPVAAMPGASSTGGWFIKDLKSSSGTFLNHIRLSGAGMESRPFPIRDGDVLQLGVDYQGGTEDIYRCVKMRVELNRGWQRAANSFNTNALRQIRALGNVDAATPKKKKKKVKAEAGASDVVKAAAPPAQTSGVTDCCICLFGVTVYQALFIAPCSHIFHFKCIRPLLNLHHPGFSCPLCRTFADLEADVEQDDPVPQEEEEDDDDEEEEEEEEQQPPVPAKDTPALASDKAEPPESALVSDFSDINLETLRPGKRLPQGAQPSQIETIAETSTASASATRSTRRSTSSTHRPRLSAGRVSTPPHSVRHSEEFSPPSAGDFDPDMRRTSIFVHGADGHGMTIPVTGRSRPGSVYDMDVSESPSQSARARSVRGLQMSTTSQSSLQESFHEDAVTPGARRTFLPSDDEDLEPPPTARADDSPTSVFTAPLATQSSLNASQDGRSEVHTEHGGKAENGLVSPGTTAGLETQPLPLLSGKGKQRADISEETPADGSSEESSSSIEPQRPNNVDGKGFTLNRLPALDATS